MPLLFTYSEEHLAVNMQKRKHLYPNYWAEANKHDRTRNEKTFTTTRIESHPYAELQIEIENDNVGMIHSASTSSMFDTTSQNRKDARKRSAKRYQHQLISSRLALENHETLSSKLLQCTLQPQPQPGKRNKTKKQVDHRAVPLSSSGSNELLANTKGAFSSKLRDTVTASRNNARRTLHTSQSLGNLQMQKNLTWNHSNNQDDLLINSSIQKESNLFLTSVNLPFKMSVSKLATAVVLGLQQRTTQTSINCFDTVLQVALEEQDHVITALMYHHIGICFKNLFDYKTSMSMQNKCITYAKKGSDQRLEGRALTGLGVCYAALGQSKRSISVQVNALTIAKTTKDEELESRVHANLGNLYRQKKDLERACVHHTLDLEISKRIDSWVGANRGAHNLALVYEDLHNEEKAKELRSGIKANAEKRDMLLHPKDSVGNIYYQVTVPNEEIAKLVSGALQDELGKMHESKKTTTV